MRAEEVSCEICKANVGILCDLTVASRRSTIGRFHNERVMKAGAEEKAKNKKKRDTVPER